MVGIELGRLPSVTRGGCEATQTIDLVMVLTSGVLVKDVWFPAYGRKVAMDALRPQIVARPEVRPLFFRDRRGFSVRFNVLKGNCLSRDSCRKSVEKDEYEECDWVARCGVGSSR